MVKAVKLRLAGQESLCDADQEKIIKYAFVIQIFRLVGQPKHFLTKAHKKRNALRYFFGVWISGFTPAAPIPLVVLVVDSVFGSAIFKALLCFATVILGALS
jgi:hypothetical protein